MLVELKKTAWYFPYERLEMHEDLGCGAFGMVKKAVAHKIHPYEPSTIVAVKMLKGKKKGCHSQIPWPLQEFN